MTSFENNSLLLSGVTEIVTPTNNSEVTLQSISGSLVTRTRINNELIDRNIISYEDNVYFNDFLTEPFSNGEFTYTKDDNDNDFIQSYMEPIGNVRYAGEIIFRKNVDGPSESDLYIYKNEAGWYVGQDVSGSDIIANFCLYFKEGCVFETSASNSFFFCGLASEITLPHYSFKINNFGEILCGETNTSIDISNYQDGNWHDFTVVIPGDIQNKPTKWYIDSQLINSEILYYSPNEILKPIIGFRQWQYGTSSGMYLEVHLDSVKVIQKSNKPYKVPFN